MTASVSVSDTFSCCTSPVSPDAPVSLCYPSSPPVSSASCGSVFAPFCPFSGSDGIFPRPSSFLSLCGSSASSVGGSVFSCCPSPVTAATVAASTVPPLFPSASYALTLPSGFVYNAPSGTSSVIPITTTPFSSHTVASAPSATALSNAFLAPSSVLYSLRCCVASCRKLFRHLIRI